MPEFESTKPMPQGFTKSEIDWKAVVTLVNAKAFSQAEDLVTRYIKSRFRAEVNYIMVENVQPTWVTDRTVWIKGTMKEEDLGSFLPSLVDDIVGETNRTVERMSKMCGYDLVCAVTEALRIRFAHTQDGWSASVKARYTYLAEV